MNQSELIDKWKHIITDLPMPTWTEPWCLAFVAEEASKASVAVEIGTFMGMSALVMMRANPNLHLWCVDIFSAFEFNEQLAAYFLRDYIREGRCELIKGTSDRAADMLRHTNGFLDLVWVDGGHSTPDVLRDIRNFYPLLKSGGVMIGHDFDVPLNDVAQGVIQSGVKYDVPVDRLWRSIKP